MSIEAVLVAVIFLSAVFVVVVLPFIINARLAKSKGQNVTLMLLLTFFFSWAVTLFLAFSKKAETSDPDHSSQSQGENIKKGEQ